MGIRGGMTPDDQSLFMRANRWFGPSIGRPYSLRSWRLPDPLLPFGISDDHDRFEPRRSFSARKCSSRRAPRTEGWHTATPQSTPTARPLGGRAVQGDRPGRRGRPVTLRPVYGGCGTLATARL